MIFEATKEGDAGKTMSKEQVMLCNMAIGHSIIEIKKTGGLWKTMTDSALNRRITLETEFTISGPCAGHDLMKTSCDPGGRKVGGTNYNCGGGVCPWGTVLSCAEGACDTCGGDIRKAAFADLLEPCGYDGSDYYGRAGFDEHCNVEKEPNEPNRFDWVVETDPYEPPSTPVKRTALGRMAHEASMVVHNKDGKVVVYMGVDDCFEYTYSFVCKAAFDPARPESGKNILDDGVLSVARVNADGIMNGLPRVHGVGPLTAEKGFASQADVLLRTRFAADAVGPTPMDRPEDMETNPAIGRV